MDTHQIRVEHAHQNIRCASRVGEWPQDIEERAYTQLFAHGRHVFHRRMVIRRKHKTDADFFQTGSNLLRRQINLHTQTLEHIGTAAFAAHTAATVLANFGASRSHDKHGASGDVEGVRAIATRTHNVDHVLGISHLHFGRELTHHLRGCGDLANRFFFHAQSTDEGSHHDRRHFTSHDEPHDVEHFVVKNFTVFDHALQRFLRRDGMGYGHKTGPYKKFFNMAWPCSVKMDSG